MISSSLLICHEATILGECQRRTSAAPNHAAKRLPGRTDQDAPAWLGVRLHVHVRSFVFPNISLNDPAAIQKALDPVFEFKIKAVLCGEA